MTAEDINESAESDEPRLLFIEKILKLIGTVKASMNPIFRFVVMDVRSNPSVLEISYNETVNMEVGMWAAGTGGFEVWKKDMENTMFTKRYLYFEILEYPGGSNDGSWRINFIPNTINLGKGVELKTSMKVTLTSPRSSGKPIQSGILKVRMHDVIAYGNMYTPPPGSLYDSPGMRFIWIYGAIFPPLQYGQYSGSLEHETKDLDILVKVKPYHAIRFESQPDARLQPDEVTSIPIILQNLGNYHDTFGFRVASDKKDIKLAAPHGISLAPGETRQTYLGLSVPQSVFDYGTYHQVTIEAYSLDDPNVTIETQTIRFETRGVYLSENVGLGLWFLIFVLVFIVIFMYYRRRSILQRKFIKPEKPWDITEESKYLEKLKEKDKEKYKEELNMMKEEYDSALLWYKYYRESILKPEPIKKKKKEKKPKKKKDKPKKPKKEEKIKKEKIKKEKKVKEKPVEKEVEKKQVEKEKKKPEPEEPKKEELKEKILEEKIDTNALKREQVLSRIRQEQEKQKRKIKGPEIGGGE